MDSRPQSVCVCVFRVQTHFVFLFCVSCALAVGIQALSNIACNTYQSLLKLLFVFQSRRRLFHMCAFSQDVGLVERSGLYWKAVRALQCIDQMVLSQESSDLVLHTAWARKNDCWEGTPLCWEEMLPCAQSPMQLQSATQSKSTQNVISQVCGGLLRADDCQGLCRVARVWRNVEAC